MTANLKKRANRLFDRWQADLQNYDRSYDNILNNFDALFFEMHNNSIPFDIAEEYITQAISAHMFDHGTAKSVYKRIKIVIHKSFDEFVKGWKEEIEVKCKEAFYTWYDLDENASPEEKQTYGGMTKRAYKKYRSYVDSFPHVDLKKLKAQQEQTTSTDNFLVEGETDGEDS